VAPVPRVAAAGGGVRARQAGRDRPAATGAPLLAAEHGQPVSQVSPQCVTVCAALRVHLPTKPVVLSPVKRLRPLRTDVSAAVGRTSVAHPGHPERKTNGSGYEEPRTRAVRGSS